MIVCGIEIKGNEAIVCFAKRDENKLTIIPTKVGKISVAETWDSTEIREFQDTFTKLLESLDVRSVFIKARLTKGKFSGSAMSFKIEAAIQLIQDFDVHVVTSHNLKKCRMVAAPPVRFAHTNLRQYQEQAYNLAVYGLFCDD